jgi:asparagine synthase (glutamine-hydrolysing)
MKIKERGPDNSYFKVHNKYNLIVGFHRLAINGLNHINADQPFVYETEDSIYYCICNGEIYNYQSIAEKYNITLTTGSDCEIILPLFLKIGMSEMMKEFDVEASLIICQISKLTHQVNLFVGRDHAGMRTLSIAYNEDTIVFSTGMKGIPFLNDNTFRVHQFPPRHYLEISSSDTDFNTPKFINYIDFADIKPSIFSFEEAKRKIRESLEKAVKSRMMSNVPIGALVSGGIDSCKIAAFCARFCKGNNKKLRTFCLAIDKESPDAKYAKLFADYTGCDHTTVILSEKECLDAVDKVIYFIESYDITSVRASVCQYLISKWVRENTDIKVLFLGDGADEIQGGYIYTLKAPSKEDFHNECLSLINNIHYFDVKRADEGVASNGLEPRVPFLSLEFIKTYLSISVDLRMPTGQYAGTEKYLIREAFRDENLIPNDILFRKKEAFSDGVSTMENSWFCILQRKIENEISDEEFEKEKLKYLHNPPHTKEALYYRKIFEKHFGEREIVAKTIPHFWMPKWCGDVKDPSARVLSHYKN